MPLQGADVFLGLSVAGIVTPAMVKSMAADAIVFAMANPVPEIMPDLALQAGARVVATGRSDFPNQVNNVLGFPGIFRGALDVRASDINEAMKVAASRGHCRPGRERIRGVHHSLAPGQKSCSCRGRGGRARCHRDGRGPLE